MLTFFQAIVLGVLQGVTELFPVSSLGHSVILPQLLGWTDVVAAQSAAESSFLAFLVGLHVATALALLIFYRATWVEIVRAPLRDLQPPRRGPRPDPVRLAWARPAPAPGICGSSSARSPISVLETAAMALASMSGGVASSSWRRARAGAGTVHDCLEVNDWQVLAVDDELRLSLTRLAMAQRTAFIRGAMAEAVETGYGAG